MLQVKDLQVYYGVINAIKGVSFEVNEGEVIALIGANGAGKTTILHTITGLVAPKAGSVIFEGKNLVKTPAHKIVGMYIRIFRVWRSARTRSRARCPAASSRCWPWGAR